MGKTKLCPSASPRGESWLGQTCSSGSEQVGCFGGLSLLLLPPPPGCWNAFRPSFVGLSQPPDSSEDVGGLVVPLLSHEFLSLLIRQAATVMDVHTQMSRMQGRSCLHNPLPCNGLMN
uniref:Uncharacterized protein n=1 Tax=Anopheles farauti TaxID=69004 RepID=A0A182QSY0_9DIPT